MLAAGQDPYDEIPYESQPFPFAQPTRLAGVARLLGLQTPEIRTARVLELGCGLGVHLLPLAVRYPEGRFVGIDYSQVQIDAALHFRDEVARDAAGGERIDNVDLRRMSIADIGPSLGTFDYIICHGVYSWVDDAIRAAILRVCRENLAPDGVAMISYNVFPGWHQARAIADMMRFHTANVAAPRAKAGEARTLLQFLIDAAGERRPNWRDVLKYEQELISKNADSYLLHDHLGSHNQPFYFHEVAARARDAGLAFVGEMSPDVVHFDQLPPHVAATLGAISDVGMHEQYLDFITNRRFRITLFCHAGRTPRREVDVARIFEFHVESDFPPADLPAAPSDAPASFVARNGTTVTTTDRHAAAVMTVLSGLGRRVASADAIAAEAAALVGGTDPAEALVRTRAELTALGIPLALRRALVLHAAPVVYARAVAKYPRAFLPSRTSARLGQTRVWTLTHTLVTLAPGDCALLALCDGTRDVAALAAAQPGANARTANWVRDRLAFFCENALLV